MTAELHEFLTLERTVSGQLHALAALTPQESMPLYSLRRYVAGAVSRAVETGKISTCTSSLYTVTTLTELYRLI